MGSITPVWTAAPTMNHMTNPTAKRMVAFTGGPPGQQHSKTEPYSKRLDLRIKRMAWIDEPPCA